MENEMSCQPLDLRKRSESLSPFGSQSTSLSCWSPAEPTRSVSPTFIPCGRQIPVQAARNYFEPSGRYTSVDVPSTDECYDRKLELTTSKIQASGFQQKKEHPYSFVPLVQPLVVDRNVKLTRSYSSGEPRNVFYEYAEPIQSFEEYKNEKLKEMADANGGRSTNPKMRRNYSYAPNLDQEVNNNNSDQSRYYKNDPEYLERRKKNNEAAKKSRDRRRFKESQLVTRNGYLEMENDRLKLEIASTKMNLNQFQNEPTAIRRQY